MGLKKGLRAVTKENMGFKLLYNFLIVPKQGLKVPKKSHNKISFWDSKTQDLQGFGGFSPNSPIYIYIIIINNKIYIYKYIYKSELQKYRTLGTIAKMGITAL